MIALKRRRAKARYKRMLARNAYTVASLVLLVLTFGALGIVALTTEGAANYASSVGFGNGPIKSEDIIMRGSEPSQQEKQKQDSASKSGTKQAPPKKSSGAFESPTGLSSKKIVYQRDGDSGQCAADVGSTAGGQAGTCAKDQPAPAGTSADNLAVKEGYERWVQFSVLFGEDWTAGENGTVLLEWQRPDGNGPAPLQIVVTDADELVLRSESLSEPVTIGAIQRGAWTDYAFHFKFSAGADGLAEAWANGANVLSLTNFATPIDGASLKTIASGDPGATDSVQLKGLTIRMP